MFISVFVILVQVTLNKNEKYCLGSYIFVFIYLLILYCTLKKRNKIIMVLCYTPVGIPLYIKKKIKNIN